MNSLRFLFLYIFVFTSNIIAEETSTEKKAPVTYMESLIQICSSLPAIPATYNPIHYIPAWPSSISFAQASSENKIQSFEQLHQTIDKLVEKIEDPNFIDTDYESIITLHRQLTQLTKKKNLFTQLL
jgi:hypothetical protein